MKILLCYGGSIYAEKTLGVGAQIARGLKSEVTLLTVEDPYGEAKVDEAQKRGAEILRGYGIVPIQKVRRGDPSQEILRESEEGYDLVTIGSHGTRGIKEFFLGATAIQVVENLRVSTLVVRDKERISKILIGIRSRRSPERNEVITTTKDIARATGSSVTLLHVVPFPVMYDIHIAKERITLSEQYPVLTEHLRRLEGFLINGGVAADAKLREGFPEEEILEETIEGNYDLIAVGASNLRGVSGILFGNFSYTIVKHAKTSVLVVKPR